MCRLQVRRDTGKQSAHWTHISERELAADAHSRNQYRRGRRRKRGRCARSVGLPRHASTHWPSRHSPLYYVGPPTLPRPHETAPSQYICTRSPPLHSLHHRTSLFNTADDDFFHRVKTTGVNPAGDAGDTSPPQYFGCGGTSTGISPPILLRTFGYSRPILVALHSLSLKPFSFGYKTPPIRFSQAGGQSAHKARPPQP